MEQKYRGLPALSRVGVISPVLANLFMHYVFDDFMVKEFKTIPYTAISDMANVVYKLRSGEIVETI